jgi:hypothetical protein
MDGPALAGLWAGFSRWAALAGLWAGFFRLALFRENLLEEFVDVGGNSDRKSSIPTEIRGIGARKFVAM